LAFAFSSSQQTYLPNLVASFVTLTHRAQNSGLPPTLSRLFLKCLKAKQKSTLPLVARRNFISSCFWQLQLKLSLTIFFRAFKMDLFTC